MSNIDAMFESDFWRACDLDNGKTFNGKIKKVDQGELQIPGTSKKKRKPVIEFSNSDKKLALNKTNSTTIKDCLGKDSAKWIGASITLYQIQDAKLGKKIVDGLRVRNVKGPDGKKAKPKGGTPPPDAETLSKKLKAIELCEDQDSLDALLEGVRKLQWTRDQMAEIAAAKAMWIAAHETPVSDSQETNATETVAETESETKK